MAAGFTVKTEKIEILQEKLEELAERLLGDDQLIKKLRGDLEIPLDTVTPSLYSIIQKLDPYGMKNPTPTFVSKNVEVLEQRLVGQEGKHIKFRVQNSEFRIDAIAFGFGERMSEFRVGDKINIAYTIEQDEWNGNKKLQLKIKDLRGI